MYENMASGEQPKHKNYQAVGDQIMQLAEILRPIIAKELANCYDENGVQVHHSRHRAIALVIAQDLVKTEPRMTMQEMADWMNPNTKHRMETIIYDACLKAGMETFTQAN